MSQIVKNTQGAICDLIGDNLEIKRDILCDGDIFCNEINAAYFNIGGLSVTGNLYLSNGTVALPSYSFTSNTSSGIYLDQTVYNSINFSIDGVRKIEIAGAATWMYSDFLPDSNNLFKLGTTGQIWSEVHSNKSVNGLGSVSLPSFTFSGFSDSGMWLNTSGFNTLNFTVNATNIFRCSSTFIQSFVDILPSASNTYNIGSSSLLMNGVYSNKFYGSVGTAALPTYTFNNDENTGIYSSTLDTINFSTGGTNRLAISNTGINAAISLNAVNVPITMQTQGNGLNSGLYFRTTTGNSLRWLIDLQNESAGLGNASLYLNYYNDVGTYISTYSFNRAGQLRFLQVGSAGTPNLCMSNTTTDTGFYGFGNDVYFSSAATLRMTFNNNALISTVPFRGAAGTVGFPSYQFSTDNNSGMYNPSYAQLAFSTNGTQAIFINSTQQIEFPGIHNATPSNNTGIQSGEYNPVTSNLSNVSAASVVSTFWFKVGKILHISGSGSMTMNIGGGGNYSFRFPVPSGFTMPTAGANRLGVCVICESTAVQDNTQKDIEPRIIRISATEVQINGTSKYAIGTVCTYAFEISLLLS